MTFGCACVYYSFVGPQKAATPVYIFTLVERRKQFKLVLQLHMSICSLPSCPFALCIRSLIQFSLYFPFYFPQLHLPCPNHLSTGVTFSVSSTVIYSPIYPPIHPYKFQLTSITYETTTTQASISNGITRAYIKGNLHSKVSCPLFISTFLVIIASIRSLCNQLVQIQVTTSLSLTLPLSERHLHL